jgi:UDP-GlcNAc:undecaprenyl-phosphate GlcNAc-1-phosphate transferase
MSTAAAVMIVSAALIAGALSHAIARFVVWRKIFPDRPNERSNHWRTTPRAGGFAIFGGFFAAMVLYAAFFAQNGVPNLYAPLIGLALGAFAFGAADDAHALGARFKLAAQIVIAIGFVAVFGAVERVPAPFVGDIDLGLAAAPLTVFWIVAFMNAFNFMDGINGIASSCALFVLCAIAVAAAGGGAAVWAAPAAFLACALFGYLPLNFPAGRLFMGDGGSQSVGFLIAAFAALTASGSGGPVTPLFTPVAFLPFLFDATFTLAHRIRRKRNIFEAHKEHLYQLLVRMGRTHEQVTTLYLTLTVISTTVAIVANAMDPRQQFVAVALLVALYLPLALAIYHRAAAHGLFAEPQKRVSEPPVERIHPLPAAAE